jgi:ATP:ADP antiporter, AAA family
MINILKPLAGMRREEKKNICLVSLSLFFVLFSYPLTRATTTSIFIQAFGAKSSPVVWLMSVAGLSGTIWLYNRIQYKTKIHFLFLLTSIFTGLFFLIGTIFYHYGVDYAAYPIFVWKEIYIVLQVHMLYAYLTSSINIDDAKLVYGPIGAFASIGGILGGILTSSLTSLISTETILLVGIIPIILASIVFMYTDRTKVISQLMKNNEGPGNPLDSIRPVLKYVLLIGVIVTLSQFVINLANMKFNFLLEEMIPTKSGKTQYLGQLYSMINGVSLGIQICLIPIFLKLLPLSVVHIIIPVSYLFAAAIGLGFGAGELSFVAGAFIFLKGADYSIFSTAKEMFYFPLNAAQKYGAKYINDIVIYRFSKGLISLILIYVQSIFIIDIFLYVFIILWVIALIPIIKANNKIN